MSLNREQFEQKEKVQQFEALALELEEAHESAASLEQKLEAQQERASEERAQAKNKLEQVEANLRAYADQVKDRNRKLGTLENKVKDLEDEQILLIEQHKDQLQSTQALMQHKIDDSKRR